LAIFLYNENVYVVSVICTWSALPFLTYQIWRSSN
jgi:hypothetical protein